MLQSQWEKITELVEYSISHRNLTNLKISSLRQLDIVRCEKGIDPHHVTGTLYSTFNFHRLLFALSSFFFPSAGDEASKNGSKLSTYALQQCNLPLLTTGRLAAYVNAVIHFHKSLTVQFITDNKLFSLKLSSEPFLEVGYSWSKSFLSRFSLKVKARYKRSNQ